MERLQDRIRDHLIGEADYDVRKLLRDAEAKLNANDRDMLLMAAALKQVEPQSKLLGSIIDLVEIPAGGCAPLILASGQSKELGAMVDAVELPDDAEPAPVVPTELTGDDRILWGVVANAGRLSDTRTYRWAHVMDATGMGSNSAMELCQRFGFNPDDRQGGEMCDAPSTDEETHDGYHEGYCPKCDAVLFELDQGKDAAILRGAIANTPWSKVPLDKLKGVADVLCSFAAPKEKLCAVSIDLPLSEADREELKDLPVGKVLGPRHGDDAGEGLRYVMCKVGLGDHWADWLFIPHADGQYVSAAKLAPFSVSIIRSALAGAPL